MGRPKTLYIDLDGPVLDVSERYYRVYLAVAQRHRVFPLPKACFWKARREGQTLEEILSVASEAVYQCRTQWLELIEQPEYLFYDRPAEGVRSGLQSLAGRHRLWLVTLRRHLDNLETQLQRLRLRGYFVGVLAGASEGATAKAELIRAAEGFRSEDSVVVGDSEVDVLAARALDVPVIAVANGIRSEVFLRALGPAAVVPSLAAVADLVAGR